MAFFNQGDFTQLGVAGHVNANLRLNEKRLVNVDMTSNENAEGCTIVGTVKDLLNNKVYNIGSAPSGNIEITANGENINVAAYATATVNVSGGGGDILMCAITFHPLSSTGTVHSGQPNTMVNPATGLLMDTTTIEINEDTELSALYVSDGENTVITYNTLEGESEAEVRNAISNMVNMDITVDNDGGVYFAILAPTDPTANSSCTINV